MIIHYDNTSIDITVDDKSYRYRRIMGDHNLTLYFSLPEHIEVPVGAWCEYQGVRYELMRPENFKKHGTRNFEYTLIMESDKAKASKYKLRNVVPGDTRLKFSYTAKPREFLELVVANLNQRDSGWSVGECIDAPEKTIAFNHTFCDEAMQMIAEAFETEWEGYNKVLCLGKVEYNKDNPLPLSYGRGNGFKPGLGRTNFDNSKPVEVLYTQGTERNIDFSKYRSHELLLPKEQQIGYDGSKFDDEDGFDATKARWYVTDAEGYSLRRADKELSTHEEDSIDLSHIYPSRVGTVSSAEEVNTEKGFWDFWDSSIPDDLDYSKYDLRIDGEKMTVEFQSGMLTGKTFDLEQSDTKTTGYIHNDPEHPNDPARKRGRFKLVSAEIDGMTMPERTAFYPKPGDKYAVFGCMLPDEYVCDNTSRSGASWEMFREAVKYMFENEDPRFSFTGELDGNWAKKDWINIGGRIIPGGFVAFSDPQFQQENVLVRIVGVKDYINTPHSPVIELSNVTVGGTVRSSLRKIDQNEVLADNRQRETIQYTKRQYRSIKETMSMLEDSMLNFSGSISPMTVRTMQMLVGDESLQFNFTPDIPGQKFVFKPEDEKKMFAPAGTLKHMTLGIDFISAADAEKNYKTWTLPEFKSAPLDEPKQAYYLYAKVSKEDTSGEFILSPVAIPMESIVGYYHLLVGLLNSEYDGDREFVTLYGFTEILPGRMTTDKIVSSNNKTFFDLLSGIIGIGNKVGLASDGDDPDSTRMWAGADANNRHKAPFRVTQDGRLIATKVRIATSETGQRFEVTEEGVVELYSQDSTAPVSRWSFETNKPYIEFCGSERRKSVIDEEILWFYRELYEDYIKTVSQTELGAGYLNLTGSGINLFSGHISGFAISARRETNPEITLTHRDCYLACCSTSSVVVVGVPSPTESQVGKVYYIKHCGIGQLYISGKLYGANAEAATPPISPATKGQCIMLVNDGQYWQWNKMTN